MKRSAMMALLLACTLLMPFGPARAASPSSYIVQGTLNSACATSTGCTQATSSQSGAQLCTNISTPSLITISIGTPSGQSPYVGVLTTEGTLDGQTYVTPNGGLPATTTSSGLTYTGTVTNVGYVCVRMSAYTSGAALVAVSVLNQPGGVVASPLDTNGYVATHEQGISTVQAAGGAMTVGGPGTAGTPAGGVLSVQVPSGAPAAHTICDSGCSSATTWTYFPVPASTLCVSAPCVIKNSAATFAAIINESTAAQPAGNCVWYDNTAASGQTVYIETTIGAGQIVTMPYPGLAATIGLTVQCAVNPGGNGLLVLYR